MNLYFQDPTYSKSYTLHEALLECFSKNNEGAGVYAFVSVDGVKLLLEDDNFIKYISKGKFELIIGVDEITNTNTVNILGELQRKYINLSVKAFLHSERGSLFHPKMVWFKNGNVGTIIVGSGNLTQKGLRRNREIFNVIDLDTAEINLIVSEWNNWLESNNKCIREINDAEVLEKVKENIPLRYKIKKKIEKKFKKTKETDELIMHIDVIGENEDIGAWNYGKNDEVLITEISNNNARISQVNFHIEDFLDFFGAVIGDKNIRVLLKNVDTSGYMQDTEIREFVNVHSHNYRIELNAMKGVTYPDPIVEGRPIGVFIKISKRMIMYSLIFPGDSSYEKLKKYLYSEAKKNITEQYARMVKYYTTVESLVKHQKELLILNAKEREQNE